ncbi:MAG: hypothetical protein Q8S46_08750 [Methylotenera sp.]|nr:hypothetical protein [Methylotenera sp.]MDP1755566.1 hypothetical protein [Methylotenera sp.]MDP1959075.1 hypothetical protein [Methylotenera sp.]MDP3206921.1 hypothetical protein [Methylotenera sp.]MDP3304225.1 hypothetical protein [Methylotenera sp.]
MKNFIKENLVLVIGLTLPLLLIVLFFVATVIPKLMGTPPQYEMLFTTNYYDYQNPPDFLHEFVVKNQQLTIKTRKNESKDGNYTSKKLMAYDGKTETVREITVDIAKTADATTGNAVVLEETKNMAIDTSSISPDGYALDGPSYGGSGLVGGFFGGGYRNSGFRLKKGSVGYQVPNTQQNTYYNQMQFIGWVIEK